MSLRKGCLGRNIHPRMNDKDTRSFGHSRGSVIAHKVSTKTDAHTPTRTDPSWHGVHKHAHTPKMRHGRAHTSQINPLKISAHAFSENTTRSHCQYLGEMMTEGTPEKRKRKKVHSWLKRSQKEEAETVNLVRVISGFQKQLQFPSTLHTTFNDILSRKQASSSENRYVPPARRKGKRLCPHNSAESRVSSTIIYKKKKNNNKKTLVERFKVFRGIHSSRSDSLHIHTGALKWELNK